MSEENPTLDAELRSDLLDVLDDLPLWRLAPLRWQQVYALLGTISEALLGKDFPALRDVVGELELTGPVRTTRIGAAPNEPPPQDVQERLNHLKHQVRSLDGSVGQGPERSDRGSSSGDGDRDDRRTTS